MDFRALLHAAGRWRDALVDPTRRDRTVLVSLAIYVLLWTVYGTIAKSSQGFHPDMTEVDCVVARSFARSTQASAVCGLAGSAWFTVFPIAGWSYYLLAMLMPAVTLWIVWRMSADYLDADKRIVGIALLTFVPFFNFHALKFNVNTVLLPLWAATTWFFLMSVRTRGTLLGHSCRGRRCVRHAWEILVDFSAGRTWAGGTVRQTPGRVFPLGGAVDHYRSRVDRAWRRICFGCFGATLNRFPMQCSFTATSHLPPHSLPRSAMLPAHSVT